MTFDDLARFATAVGGDPQAWKEDVLELLVEHREFLVLCARERLEREARERAFWAAMNDSASAVEDGA